MDHDTSPSPAPTKPKRRTARVLAVQAEIIKRRLADEDVRSVAAALKVNTETVTDVFAEYWELSRPEREADVEEERQRRVAAFKLVAAEAWSAWTDSRAPVKETAADGTVTETPGGGNFRFLEMLTKAEEKVARYTGVDAMVAPTNRVELSGPEGGPIPVDIDVTSLSDEQLEALVGKS